MTSLKEEFNTAIILITRMILVSWLKWLRGLW